MEHESHHHHHPHKTGVRWLDVSMAVAAAVVSLVSLWLGLHSAHSMEKLVAANSYPHLEIWQSRLGEDMVRKKIDFHLANNGVGPARIEWVQLAFEGKPVADLTALFEACCKLPGQDLSKLNERGGISGALIPAAKSVSMFSWDEPAVPNASFAALHGKMGSIAISACYCSVFDECYVRRAGSAKPESVEQCRPPKVTFQPGFR